MEFQTTRVELGSDIIIPCPLSFMTDMEIRWFKETDCICLYKNRQLSEGRSYKNRISLITEELNRVSLRLRYFRQSDLGDYICQVINGDTINESTIRVENKDILSRFTDATQTAGFAGLIGILGVVLAAVMLAAESMQAKIVPIVLLTGTIMGVGKQVMRAVALAKGNISFKTIYRKLSEQERKKMERSDLLTEVYLQPFFAGRDRLIMNQGTLIMTLQDKIKRLQAELEGLKKVSLDTQQEMKKLQVIISSHTSSAV